MAKKKNKQQKHKSNKTIPQHQQTGLIRILQSISKGWRTFFWILGILATLSGVLSFLPRISVEPSPPMQAGDLLTAPFVISNDGILTLHNVSFYVYLHHIEDAMGRPVITNNKRGMEPIGYLIPALSPGEKSTTGLPHPFAEPTISGDIDFVVTYHPAWLPWEQKKAFRFGGSRESDGTLIWRHLASSK